MSEQKQTHADVISFLRGGEVENIREIVETHPDETARSIKYMLEQKVHRQNLITTVLELMAQSNTYYREVAWALIQEIPLSYFTDIMGLVTEPARQISNRLRHALVNKICKEDEGQIIRAFLISPDKFREMFNQLKLPATLFDDQPITNPNYQLAISLTETMITDYLNNSEQDLATIRYEYGIPLSKIIAYVDDPMQVLSLAESSNADDYFNHVQWFKQVIGEDEFNRVAEEKLKHVKNPAHFLQIEQHLKESGYMTDYLLDKMKARTDQILSDIMAEQDITKVSLIVDKSGSMDSAVEITQKMYDIFTNMGSTVLDIIAFDTQAHNITPRNLSNLVCNGGTNIRGALTYFYQTMINPDYERPDVVFLITDFLDNSGANDVSPYLEDLGIPLVILLVESYGGKYRQQSLSYKLDYPHAMMEIKDFKQSMVIDLMREIAKLTAKTIKEETVTKVVQKREIQEESVSQIILPERPEESLKRGYLKKLLIS